MLVQLKSFNHTIPIVSRERRRKGGIGGWRGNFFIDSLARAKDATSKQRFTIVNMSQFSRSPKKGAPSPPFPPFRLDGRRKQAGRILLVFNVFRSLIRLSRRFHVNGNLNACRTQLHSVEKRFPVCSNDDWLSVAMAFGRAQGRDRRMEEQSNQDAGQADDRVVRTFRLSRLIKHQKSFCKIFRFLCVTLIFICTFARQFHEKRQ